MHHAEPALPIGRLQVAAGGRAAAEPGQRLSPGEEAADHLAGPARIGPGLVVGVAEPGGADPWAGAGRAVVAGDQAGQL